MVLRYLMWAMFLKTYIPELIGFMFGIVEITDFLHIAFRNLHYTVLNNFGTKLCILLSLASGFGSRYTLQMFG